MSQDRPVLAVLVRDDALGDLHELVADRPVADTGDDRADEPAATAAHREAERREVDVHFQRGAAQHG